MVFTKKEIIPIFLILLMVAAGIGLFRMPCLPDRMPSHWNAQGEIDGYSGKGFALFFSPALAVALYLLMFFLPRIDPFRRNYKKFERPYYFIRLFLVAFLFLLYFYTISAALGFKFNIIYFMIPALSLLFLGLGAVMPKIKRNYFVGFRTPWTLQSDEVWTQTHEFAGKAFMAAAVVSFFSIFFGKHAFWVFFIVIIVGALAPLAYSYVIYRRLGLFRDKRRDKGR